VKVDEGGERNWKGEGICECESKYKTGNRSICLNLQYN
jgi:hypothetical protein